MANSAIESCLLASMLALACSAQEPVSSPSGRLRVHYTLCSNQTPCIPEVVITDRAGAEVRRFHVRDDEGPCVSILDVHWAGEQTVGATCHGNPSLNYYFEIDVESGKALRRYLGFRFVRSPDGSKVAHVGWIMHFAPPWVQSHYLQIGDIVIYPLPPATKPVTLKQPEMAPEVVVRRGLIYEGVHEFRGRFVWAPDSRHVGFIDCVGDYRLQNEEDERGGDVENTRCSAVVVGLDGKYRSAPFPDTRDIALRWTDRLVAVANGKSVTVRAP